MRRRKPDRGKKLEREIAKGWETVALLETKIRKLYENELSALNGSSGTKTVVSSKLDSLAMLRKRRASLENEVEELREKIKNNQKKR